MNERLPYEEQIIQQWDDLPLPDENMAWEDMKRRLEEDDDHGIIPFWIRGCGLWGLLLVVLVGIGWWLYKPPLSEIKKEQGIIRTDIGSTKKTAEKKDTTGLFTDNSLKSSTDNKLSPDQRIDHDSVSGDREMHRTTSIVNRNREILTVRTKSPVDKPKVDNRISKQRTSKVTNKERKREQVIDKENINTFPGSELKVDNKNQDQAIKKNPPGVAINDSPDSIPAGKKDIDSTVSDKKDSTAKQPGEDLIKNNIPKKDSSKTRSTSFSVGLAMHQLIPVDGQKLTPYNSQGRKGSLADYIPSVFGRMYRNDKWFLQAEFRYGAPQYEREVIYQQENQLDTFNITNTITSAKLKKTFYHQLPVSFNYYVLPNFSIGGGFVWNRFQGAVSEQDVVQRTVSTGVDTVLSKGVILTSEKADSNFVKSYVQALVETQYTWKRFSLGARYSSGLQPYLKFTLPGGTQQKERNRSLQVFLRYELWRSKASFKTP